MASVDLNIRVANRVLDKLTYSDVIAAVSAGNLDDLNEAYFSKADVLQNLAKQFEATWTLKDGFHFDYERVGCPKSIIQASKSDSPCANLAFEIVEERIHKTQCALVAISIAVPTQLVHALALGRFVKERFPKVIVAVGGNVVSHLGVKLAKPEVFKCFDLLCVYQGVETIDLILKSIERGGGGRGAPNIIFKVPGGYERTEIRNPRATKFPTPSFSDVETRAYWGCNYLPIVGAYGCYYGKCTFCSIPFGWGNKGYLGNSSVSRVIETMIDGECRLSNTNWKFIEEALHPRLTQQVSEAILHSGLSVKWEGYARLDRPWSETTLLETAAKAGLSKLYVGFEQVASAGRDGMNKKDHADPLSFLKRCADNGVKVHAFTMVGFPGTTEKNAFDTLEFLLDNRSLVDTVDVSAFEYAFHTSVPGVERIESDNDWALSSPYRPLDSVSLTEQESWDLAKSIEHALMVEHPTWLHPIYRMVSPWSD